MEKQTEKVELLTKVAGFSKLTASARVDAQAMFDAGIAGKFAIMFAGKSAGEVAQAAVSGYGQFTAAIHALHIKCSGDWESIRSELHKAGFDVNSSSYRMAKKRLLDAAADKPETAGKAAVKAKDAAEKSGNTADKGAEQKRAVNSTEAAQILLADGAVLKKLFAMAAADADIADQLDEYAAAAGLCIRTRPKK